MSRADQGHPSIYAQTARVIVVIGHTASALRRHHPTRLEIPEFELLLDTSLDAFASHDATKHAGRRFQCAPVSLRQTVDRLEEYGAVLEQLGTRMRRRIVGPLKPRIAHVDREKGHEVL